MKIKEVNLDLITGEGRAKCKLASGGVVYIDFTTSKKMLNVLENLYTEALVIGRYDIIDTEDSEEGYAAPAIHVTKHKSQK